MTFFAGAVRLDGGPVPRDLDAAVARDAYCRARTITRETGDGFVAIVERDAGGLQPAIAHVGTAVVVGVARLDNRMDVARRLGCDAAALSDLQLAARVVLGADSSAVAQLHGDFALAAFDLATRRVVAARDSFGVRKLYYASPRAGVFCFASRAGLLANGDAYDVAYLAERIAYATPSPERTVYAGVLALPPASVLRLDARRRAVSTYWSARDAQHSSAAPPAGERAQCEAFRALLIDAVRTRLPADPVAWSHLSGGLDSSSIVSVAQWLAHTGQVPHGLAGTISYTDALGTAADERRYSDAVVARWAIRNACVPHRIPRAEVLQDLPLLDQPDRPFEAAYRDRTAARVVRESGGRVLFTGLGGDNLVLGTMFFFADQLWTGQVREALREMIHRAALGRVSFWTLAYRNAVLPLLPARMRAWLMRGSAHGVPVWIAPRLARGLALERRVASAGIIGARRGHQYEDALAAMVAAIPSTVGLGPLEDALDVRHPFLHRPLVELALALPPEFCVRPHARKWVLREATRGIVPEQVRTRIGKGSSDGLDAWSLMHEQEDARRLLRDPILAELGCIEPARLRALIDAVGRGQIANSPATERIRGTLEVEMWLQVRSGRWAADDASRDTARLARGA